MIEFIGAKIKWFVIWLALEMTWADLIFSFSCAWQRNFVVVSIRYFFPIFDCVSCLVCISYRFDHLIYLFEIIFLFISLRFGLPALTNSPDLFQSNSIEVQNCSHLLCLLHFRHLFLFVLAIARVCVFNARAFWSLTMIKLNKWKLNARERQKKKTEIK